MLDIKKLNEETLKRAREAEEDAKRVEASQDGSHANKNLNAVFVGGKYNGMKVSHEQLEKMGNGKFTLRFSALKVHNKNLINLDLEDQPLVDEYVSPMFDGDDLIYVTQEVYDVLFD